MILYVCFYKKKILNHWCNSLHFHIHFKFSAFYGALRFKLKRLNRRCIFQSRCTVKRIGHRPTHSCDITTQDALKRKQQWQPTSKRIF